MKVSNKKLSLIKKLYFKHGKSMASIANILCVSLDSVVYFMRKYGISRRTSAESNAINFINKKPTFKKRKTFRHTRELKSIIAMLYWGEGYKGSNNKPSKIVDFTNSDPEMIRLFLFALRNLYKVDEKKFRVQLYCYSDQNLRSLIKFWSSLTSISAEQFIKPFVRSDFNSKSRKMIYGMVHIRYQDKKLLLEIMNLVDYFKHKFAPVV